MKDLNQRQSVATEKEGQTADIPATRKPVLPDRPVDAHKGTFGTALLLCGSYGMCGAEILAVKAALRMGVGLVRAFVCRENYAPFCVSVPEAVTLPVETSPQGGMVISSAQLAAALAGAKALLIGCGLGRSAAAEQAVFSALEQTEIPTVLDADGINAVAGNINLIRKVHAPLIITPHPGEMARLCQCSIDKIEQNRVDFAQRFAVDNSCTVVLKGHRTVIALPNGQVLKNGTGCSGMATGGSGDVLSGMLVSLLAQGMAPDRATEAAVWLHGYAGESAGQRLNERYLLPGDIIDELKNIL